MTLSPSFTFGLIVAIFVGSLAHLIMNGSGRRLLVLLLSSGIGFALGDGLGSIMGINVLVIGDLNMLTGSLGSLIGVTTAIILTSRRLRARQTR
jgi:hypothetical protein